MLSCRVLIRACSAVVMTVLAASPVLGQAASTEAIDTQTNWKIRREATTHSHVLETLHHLTDVYGPRLSGSPNLEAAGRWAVAQMEAWGLANGALEPFDFGHPGWLNERLSAHLVAPVKDSLVLEALAWTPGTDGAVRAEAYHMTFPRMGPTPSSPELEANLGLHRGKLAGKIVLVGQHQRVSVTHVDPPTRRDETALRRQLDTAPTPPRRPRETDSDEEDEEEEDREDENAPLGRREVEARIASFLKESGALVRVNDAGRDHGQIRAFQNRTYDVAQVVPTVVMRNEDFGRISRLLEHGAGPVELEFDIVNRTYPEGTTVHNAIAEIPGSDLADEVIMLGGHLDSWHAATGATDNAFGVAVMMEAVRILTVIGATPRRTIRVALWGGEEQGLIGSQAYVKEHFGSPEEPTADYPKFGGYFNVDSGTGRLRSAQVFGPAEAADVLRHVLAPFADLGVVGAQHTYSRRRGGSDHTSFNEMGLPGISMRQDPIEYGTHTWHTNLDTYERVIEQEAIAAAIVVAAAVHELANRDELLPRFDAESMPPAPDDLQ